jgi:hypothetical protein
LQEAIIKRIPPGVKDGNPFYRRSLTDRNSQFFIDLCAALMYDIFLRKYAIPTAPASAGRAKQV